MAARCVISRSWKNAHIFHAKCAIFASILGGVNEKELHIKLDINHGYNFREMRNILHQNTF